MKRKKMKTRINRRCYSFTWSQKIASDSLSIAALHSFFFPHQLLSDCTVLSEHCNTDDLLGAKLAGSFHQNNCCETCHFIIRQKCCISNISNLNFAWMHRHHSFLGSPPVMLPLGGETHPFILEQPP